MDLELRRHGDVSDPAREHPPCRAYGRYTAAAALSVFFLLRRVHETRGKELEQMEG